MSASASSPTQPKKLQAKHASECQPGAKLKVTAQVIRRSSWAGKESIVRMDWTFLQRSLTLTVGWSGQDLARTIELARPTADRLITSEIWRELGCSTYDLAEQRVLGDLAHPTVQAACRTDKDFLALVTAYAFAPALASAEAIALSRSDWFSFRKLTSPAADTDFFRPGARRQETAFLAELVDLLTAGEPSDTIQSRRLIEAHPLSYPFQRAFTKKNLALVRSGSPRRRTIARTLTFSQDTGVRNWLRTLTAAQLELLMDLWVSPARLPVKRLRRLLALVEAERALMPAHSFEARFPLDLKRRASDANPVHVVTYVASEHGYTLESLMGDKRFGVFAGATLGGRMAAGAKEDSYERLIDVWILRRAARELGLEAAVRTYEAVLGLKGVTPGFRIDYLMGVTPDSPPVEWEAALRGDMA